MFRDREEELQRLEEELLAQEEETDEETEEEYDEEDEFDEEYEEEYDIPPQTKPLPKPGRDFRAYNTDHLDTDLDTFSEEVREGRRGNVLPWVFVAMTAVLLLLLYLYLKQGGYLG